MTTRPKHRRGRQRVRALRPSTVRWKLRSRKRRRRAKVGGTLQNVGWGIEKSHFLELEGYLARQRHGEDVISPRLGGETFGTAGRKRRPTRELVPRHHNIGARGGRRALPVTEVLIKENGEEVTPRTGVGRKNESR